MDKSHAKTQRGREASETTAGLVNQRRTLLLNLKQRDCLAVVNWKGQTETTSGHGKCHLVSYVPLSVPVPSGLHPAKHMQCGVALVWRLNKSLLHNKHLPAAKEPNESSMSFLQIWRRGFNTLNLVILGDYKCK